MEQISCHLDHIYFISQSSLLKTARFFRYLKTLDKPISHQDFVRHTHRLQSMSNYRTADSSHFVQLLHQPPCLPQTKVVSLPTPSVRAVLKRAPPLSPARSMSPPRRMPTRKTRPADSPATQHTRLNRRLKRKLPRRCSDVEVYVLRDEVADSELRLLRGTGRINTA